MFKPAFKAISLSTILLVTACGSDGGGSNGVAPEPTITEPGPIADNSLTATSGDSRITVQWQAGSQAESYTIYYKVGQAFDEKNFPHPKDEFNAINSGGNQAFSMGDIIRISNITETHHVIEGLTNGITYYIKVAPVNAFGEGKAIQSQSLTPAAPVVFGAPQSLVVEAQNRSMNVSWNPVLDTASYTVYYASQSFAGNPANSAAVGGKTVEVLPAASGSLPPTSISIFGLNNDTQYFVLVTANSNQGNGESPPSIEQSVMPSVPSCNCVSIGNATCP